MPSDETTRLLPSSTSPPQSRPTSPSLSSQSRQPRLEANLHDGDRGTVLRIFAVFLPLVMASYISFAAETAILQQIVCDNYYGKPSLDTNAQDRCKVRQVQAEVATINGWRSVFEILPPMVVIVPYGMLADRIGRKPVFLLAICGCFLSDLWVRTIFWFADVIPVRAIWFAGLWQLIGAGALSMQSIVHVMVADACAPDQRTTAFAQIQSASLLAEFMFVPVGGALLEINPWICLFASSSLMVVGFVATLLFVPETWRSVETEQGQCVAGQAQSKWHLLDLWKSFLANLITLMKWARDNGRVVLIITAFFTCTLGRGASGPLFLQYTSKRLGWSLGKASYLVALGAGVNLIVHAFAIPALSIYLLQQLHLHEISKDKRIAQLSGIFLISGSILIFLAASARNLVTGHVVASLGLAFLVPVRSVVTSMVPQEHRGLLYTVIAIFTFAGMLTGGPTLAAIFRWGMDTGDFWTGLPFAMAASCYALALLAVSVASRTETSED
ncbi:MFS general substrate transporter [Sarocladium strictum]